MIENIEDMEDLEKLREKKYRKYVLGLFDEKPEKNNTI